MSKRERDELMCQLMDGREAAEKVGGYRLCQVHIDLLRAIVEERTDRCNHREAAGRCGEGIARQHGNTCPRYCGAHCKAHRDEHDCQRGRKRDYMRHFMARRYRESRERTKQLDREVAA